MSLQISVHVSYFDVGDDGHGHAHIVEGVEEDVGSSAVHELQRFTKLAHEVSHFFEEIHPDVALVASVVEQVAHGAETGFLIAELVHVADAQQRLEVGEGDCWAS